MKIIDKIWFNQLGEFRPIGIVIGEDEITGETKIYIGMGHGHSEEQDIEEIAKTGAKIYQETVDLLVRKLNNPKPDKELI